MARRSLTRQDYEILAQQYDLIFAAAQPPAQARHTTVWRCVHCGRLRQCSYNNVKYGKNGCICRSGITLTDTDYQALAGSLSLRWSGQRVPENAHIKTMWFSPASNSGFMASYHDIGYGRISRKLKRLINGEKTARSRSELSSSND